MKDRSNEIRSNEIRIRRELPVNYEDQYFYNEKNYELLKDCLVISHFNISKNYKFVTFNIFYQSFEIFMVITNYVTENPSVQNCKRTP